MGQEKIHIFTTNKQMLSCDRYLQFGESQFENFEQPSTDKHVLRIYTEHSDLNP